MILEGMGLPGLCIAMFDILYVKLVGNCVIYDSSIITIRYMHSPQLVVSCFSKLDLRAFKVHKQ